MHAPIAPSPPHGAATTHPSENNCKVRTCNRRCASLRAARPRRLGARHLVHLQHKKRLAEGGAGGNGAAGMEAPAAMRVVSCGGRWRQPLRVDGGRGEASPSGGPVHTRASGIFTGDLHGPRQRHDARWAGIPAHPPGCRAGDNVQRSQRPVERGAGSEYTSLGAERGPIQQQCNERGQKWRKCGMHLLSWRCCLVVCVGAEWELPYAKTTISARSREDTIFFFGTKHL